MPTPVFCPGRCIFEWRNIGHPQLEGLQFCGFKECYAKFQVRSVVYTGWMNEKTLAPSKLSSGMIVAIKKLNPDSMHSFQEWQGCVYDDCGCMHVLS